MVNIKDIHVGMVLLNSDGVLVEVLCFRKKYVFCRALNKKKTPSAYYIRKKSDSDEEYIDNVIIDEIVNILYN